MLLTNQDHEKINILSLDLRLIYNNLVQDAQSRLDLHLPSYDNDHMKSQIDENLRGFLLDVFSMALSSLVIDGDHKTLSTPLSGNELAGILTLKPAEVVEPFDVSLNSQLREVLENVEKETTALAMLRKELPALSEAHFKAMTESVDERVATLTRDIDAADDPDDYENENENDLQLRHRLNALIPDLNQAAEDYKQHITDLSRLKSLVPELQGNLRRQDEKCEILRQLLESNSSST